MCACVRGGRIRCEGYGTCLSGEVTVLDAYHLYHNKNPSRKNCTTGSNVM